MKISFHDTLWNLKNDELLRLLKLLEVKPELQNKGALVDKLKAEYSGEGLRRMWESLSQLERLAVAEALYHPDHLFQGAMLAAKYGDRPPFYIEKEVKRGQYIGKEKIPTRLNLFFFSTRDVNGVFLPADLADRLRGFVPEPKRAKLSAADAPPPEEGLTVRSTEPEALAEVMALLRLAEAGELRVSDKTAMPSAAGVRKILECLPMGDLFPPEVAFLSQKESCEQEIGAMKPVAWSRLLVNAGLVDVRETKSKLTRKGMKILANPPHQILKELWIKWAENNRFDELNRVEAIKGQNSKGNPLTPKPDRRNTIETCLEDCPVGKWVKTSEFSQFMIAVNQTFQVARIPERLYFCEPHYGNLGYSGFGGWNILQFRYILCLLMEYMGTLGMVDLAYVHPEGALDDLGGIWGADDLAWLSRYDGLRAFRLTALGAYVIGLENAYNPPPSGSTALLEVGVNQVIRHLSGSLQPADRLLLDAWAERIEADAWRLDRMLAIQAVERGQKAEDFAAFLRSRDPQPLPQTVEGFLAEVERDGRAVRCCGEALLFECRDEETAERICAHKGLSPFCHPCGGIRIAVPIVHAEKFKSGVRQLGLGLM